MDIVTAITTPKAKLAFPWLCIKCEGFNRGEPAHRSYWGRVCFECWQWVKERTYAELTNDQPSLEHNTVT